MHSIKTPYLGLAIRFLLLVMWLLFAALIAMGIDATIKHFKLGKLFELETIPNIELFDQDSDIPAVPVVPDFANTLDSSGPTQV